MPYVRRNENGEISAVSQEKLDNITESVDENSAELHRFLHSVNQKKEQIEQTDLNFVRVLEDVIDLLIAKNIILLTELPSKAQQKIAERQHLRSALRPHLDLLDDEKEESLF